MDNQKLNPNPYSDLIKDYPDRIFNGITAEQLFEITNLFGTERPCYLEIGSGSGGFLIEHAALNPTAGYLGLEIRYKRCVRTMQKALKRSVDNLWLIRQDANLILPLLPSESISGIYINFPDPWDKARWLKHRMISKNFLDQAYRVLKPAAFLRLKTDHQDYYQSSRKIIDDHSQFQLTDFTEDLHQSQFQSENILTEFEQLFQSQRKNIYYLSASRL